MLLESNLPGSPADWLKYAHSDLELARIERPAKVLLEGLCFHAQQAAEKSLKAILVAHNIPFPKTHNIRTLLDLLPESIAITDEVQNAAILTDYAVMSRYPGVVEPVEEDEYLEAVRLAKMVVCWAEGTIQSTPNAVEEQHDEWEA